MKNFFKTQFVFWLFNFIFLYSSIAQIPASYVCSLRNDSLLSPNIYEFDIYIQNTDNSNLFELSVFQASVSINNSAKNGGVITPTIISGSSQLTSSQIPTSVLFNNTLNSIQLAPKSPPGFTYGTNIGTSSPGLRICRIRLTNSLNFGLVRPNLTFLFTGASYRTIIGAYNQQTGLNTNITVQNYFSVTPLANPLLNEPIPIYAVSGSGFYCEGSSGRTVNLNGSQVEVKYQLKKNGMNNGGEVSGSGGPIIWVNNTFGNYKVNARRSATFMTTVMNDSAIIHMDSLTIAGSVIGGTTISFGASTDTLFLTGQRGNVIKWQKQYNGGGYSDISSTTGMIKYIEVPSSPGTWNYRSVVQNGTCTVENSASTTVIVSALPLTRYWTGAVDEVWNKTNNWNPMGIPSSLDNVIIPGSLANMPVVNTQGLGCHDLIITNNATFTINSGITFTIVGEMSK
jgi:hypothetical protein